MTVDTSRPAVEALIADLRLDRFGHDSPVADMLAALLNQRDQQAASATQFATELSRCQHGLEVAQQRIRHLEAEIDYLGAADS